MFSSLGHDPVGQKIKKIKIKTSNEINSSESFVQLYTSFPSLAYTSNISKKCRGGKKTSTGVRGSVAEVLFGEQQQSFAVHLEGAAGDWPQGKLLLGPSQPLGHVLPAPKHWLQTWRWKDSTPEFGKEATKVEVKRKGRKKRTMSSVKKRQ